MTAQTQAEALRLADEFKLCNEYDCLPSMNDIDSAAAELRRLHARVVELEAKAQPAREPLAEFIERCGDVRFQRVRVGIGGPLRWDIEFTTNGGRQEVEALGSTLAQAIARAITKEKP